MSGRRLFRALFAGVYAFFLAVASVLPASSAPLIALPHVDKVFHMMAYAVLALLWAWNFSVPRGGPEMLRRDVRVGLACVLYGMSLEVVQGLLPYGRDFSLADAAANAIGVILALVGWRFSNRA